MPEKKQAEQSESRPVADSAQSQQQELGNGSRIEGSQQKKVYDKAFETAHADDKTPSQLDIPAHGNNFRITGQHDLRAKNDGRKVPSELSQLADRSVTISDLEARAKQGDPFAQRFLQRQTEINEKIAPGAEREQQLTQLQRDIDIMFGVHEEAHRADETQAPGENGDKAKLFSTNEISLRAKDNQLAAAGEQMLANTSDPKVRESIKKDISEALSYSDSSPMQEAPNQVIEKQDGKLQLNINAVENIPAQEVAKEQGVSSGNDFQSVMHRISQLPLDQQMQVIGKGLQTFNESIEESKRETAIGTTIGVVQGIGNTLIGIVNFAQFIGDSVVFAADIATNNPRYHKTAENVGEAIGKTLVAGVQLFSLAGAYAKSVDASGDYTKPFKDISALGQELDSRWLALPPRERARMASSFMTELGANMLPMVGAAKLAKSEKLVTTLEEIGTGVNGLKDVAAEQKYVRAAGQLLDELESSADLQKLEKRAANVVGEVEDASISLEKQAAGAERKTGSLEKQAAEIEEPSQSIRDIDGDRHNDALSDKPPSRYTDEQFREILNKLPGKVSPEFIEAIANEVAKLSDFEKDLLGKIADFKPATSLAADARDQTKLTTLGSFRLQGGALRLGEFVWKSEEWMKTENVAFTLRHELGHAFNVLFKDFAAPISEGSKEFKTLCNAEFNALSEDMKYKLFSRFKNGEKDGKVLYNMAEVWDEVFADGFAHTRPGVAATESYNLLMKDAFKNTIGFVGKHVSELTSKQ